MKKQRNSVSEEVAYLTKESRAKEPKREYHRREKHRRGEYENEKIPRTRKRAIEEQRLSESEDWGSDSEWLDPTIDGLEPEEDPPTTG